MDWTILWTILGTLGVVVVAFIGLWGTLRKGYKDYMACIEDGVVTDAEKITLADNLLKAIEEAKNAWTFIWKLIMAFRQIKR